MPKKKTFLEKILIFSENYFIFLFLSIISLISILNHIYIGSKFSITDLETFFASYLTNFMINEDSTLISIAAIFIGMYFTVYTLFSNLKIDAIFSILEQENFNRLLRYIRNAFIGAFLYLIVALFTKIEINQVNFYVLIFLFICLLYMLLSALRFGIVIYIIFKSDIKRYYKFLDEEKRKKQKLDDLLIKLDDFLNSENQKNWNDYHENISNEIKKKTDD